MSATYTPVTMVGDGTTTASRARTRWQRWRVWVLIGAVVVVGALALVLPQPRTSGVPYATDNPGRDGAQALARILGEHGVHVTTVHSAQAALDQARRGDTLAVVGDLLTDDDARRLSTTGADLVTIDVGSNITLLVPGVQDAGGLGTTEIREARCDDPDAQAAGTITAEARVTSVDPRLGATVCFPSASYYDDATTGSFLTFVSDGRRTTVLADGTAVVNSGLAEEGNAALALRTLGRHAHLVWFVPAPQQATTGQVGTWDVLPPWVRMLALQALVVALVAALWRGRRLGPVLAEPLPVVVPAAEASRGRARLYRKVGARGRAAAALRAGTAQRLGTRLGLPRSAPPDQLVDAVARASQRSGDEVTSLLYGPPPPDDQTLVRLAQELDRLENEVHHP